MKTFKNIKLESYFDIASSYFLQLICRFSRDRYLKFEIHNDLKDGNGVYLKLIPSLELSWRNTEHYYPMDNGDYINNKQIEISICWLFFGLHLEVEF